MWKERIEKKKFKEGFAEEIKEIYALTQDDVGSCCMKGECCWTASMRLFAHIDGETAELKQEKKVLQRMPSEKESKKPGKVLRSRKETTYRLRVREPLPKKTIWLNQEIPTGVCLPLADVPERNVRQPQLQELPKEYQKPVFLSPLDTCQLQLNCSLLMFQGEGDWNARKVKILLDTGEHDDKCADKTLAVFCRLQEDTAAWDKKARRYAAEQLFSRAIGWQDEDEDELCADEFICRIRIESANVSQDRESESYYGDGDIFVGHAIIVGGNMEKGLYDAQLAGQLYSKRTDCFVRLSDWEGSYNGKRKEKANRYHKGDLLSSEVSVFQDGCIYLQMTTQVRIGKISYSSLFG